MKESGGEGVVACRLSVAASVMLLIGGVVLCGYLLELLSLQTNVEMWKFLAFEAAALVPVVAGGGWLMRLWRRTRLHGRRNGSLGTVVFGIVLVGIGMLLFAFSSGMVMPQWRKVLLSWQMLLLAIGVIRLCRADIVSGVTFAGVGTFFLLPRINSVFPGTLAVSSDFASSYWPILLAVFGAALILEILIGRSRRHQRLGGRNICRRASATASANVSGVTGSDGTVDYNVVFSDMDRIFLEPVFRGGSIRAVFGGVELDLRRASLPEGITYLNVEAVFGGVELKVPDDWNVTLESHSIFGGAQDERHPFQHSEQDDRRLVIVANCAFGGCSVE